MKLKRFLSFILVITTVAPLMFACAPKKVPVTIDIGNGYELPSTLVGTAAANMGLPEELCSVAVTAKSSVGRTIPTNTEFTLRFSAPTNTETVEEHLYLSPAASLNISRVSDTEYIATPENELDPGTVYRLSLGTDGKAQISFAFQTESRFAVSSTIPADLATNVPVNSGIELDFTSQIKSGTDISDYISVSPAFEWSAELYPNGKRLAVIPKKHLDKNAEYTVTVKKGFPAANGEALENDISIRFRTSADKAGSIADKKYYINLSPAPITVRTGESGVFSFAFGTYRDYNAEIKQLSASIYAYKNADAMLNAVKEFNEKGAELIATGEAYRYPSQGLSKAYTGELEYHKNTTGRNHFAYLPKLDAGYYLADITLEIKVGGKTEKETTQILLQVSDISAYFEQTEKELLIWTHEGATPVKNAEITAEFFSRQQNFSTENASASYTKQTAKTAEDGVARFEVPEDRRASICKIKSGKSTLLLFPGGLDGIAAEQRYSYVFTDRSVYFGDDTVNFSGIIMLADGTVPEKIWLRTNYGGAKYPISVAEDGYFEGSYVLEGFYGYGITLQFSDEQGKILASQFVRVTAEDKPVYTANITYDKLFYESGDTANITVNATFFDGTPASGLKFRVYVHVPGSRKDFEVTTAKDGTATVSYRLPRPDVSSTYPTYVSATAELMGNETASLYISNSATYIHSKFYFTAETAYENGVSYGKVLLNKVDTSAIKTEADLNYTVFPKNTVGKPMDGDARVTLTKVTYVRRSMGVEYDPINKVTNERFTYDRREDVVKSEVRLFNDGVMRLEHIENEAGFNGYYYYTVTYKDYTLRVNATSRNVDNYDAAWEGFTLTCDKEAYSVGDTMRLTVTEYPETTDTLRSYLVTVLCRDSYEHFVTNDREFELPYKEEYVSGVSVNVTVVEENSVNLISCRPLYDYVKNSGLTLEIVPDGTEYKPGDTVSVTVKVTDKNGKAAPVGTRVTLAVVDEACFALGDQTLDILSALYGGVRTPSLERNWSFSLFYAYDPTRYYLYSGMSKNEVAEDAAMTEAPTATGGGAEADNVRVRSYFADNPVYEMTVSENGSASFTFTAPDNITEWRLTAAAAYSLGGTNGSILAGNASTDVIVTLPFFINAGYLESYIEGDDVTCSARVYGKAVSKSFNTVAAVYDENGKLIKDLTASAKAGEFSYFSFGKLEAGEYVLRITCTALGAGDAVQYPFSVVKTAVLAEIEKPLEIKEIKDITPAKYPVILSFVNKEQREFLNLAHRLSYTGSTRSDAIAASISAQNLLSAYTGTIRDGAKQKTALNSRYTNSGLLSLLPYSSGELKLSALIAACSTDALTKTTLDTLSVTFYRHLNGKCTEEELVYSLLGLAACGEPILTDLEQVASGCEKFSDESKLVLAAAFAVIGDHGAAWEIYSDIRSKLFTVTDNGTLGYFGTKNMNTEEKLALSATALISASVCARDDARLIVDFLLSHTSRVELYDLPIAFYLANYIPPVSTESTLVYTVGGEKMTQTLKAGSFFRIMLTKSEFESFEVLEATDLSAYVRYIGSAEEAAGENMRSDELNIEKTVVPAGNGIYLVTVSYKVVSDKDNVQFRITDTIPSGARFLRHGSNSTHSKNSYLWLSNSAQTMEGYLGCYNDSKGISGLVSRTYTGSFSYYIRTAIPGEYVVEAAFAQNTDSGAFAVSERGTITLK
ncbi:MAG: hypothetical protein E7619_01480 [Ruminococcaceae bacterium]|nr:hypothetical protein [Oscillospiraceae bacterium]